MATAINGGASLEMSREGSPIDSSAPIIPGCRTGKRKASGSSSKSAIKRARLEKIETADGHTTGSPVVVPTQLESSEMPAKVLEQEVQHAGIQPFGRFICDFRSNLELLRAMRDAIKAHRSLLQVDGILHRDISIWSIIITEPTSGTQQVYGTLTNVGSHGTWRNGKLQRHGRQRMTMTPRYMAIKVLEASLTPYLKVEHSYRHDLESFFYVFLDLCTPDGWPHFWSEHNLEQVECAKFADMALFRDRLLPEFSPQFASFHDLALELHRLLFRPPWEKPMWTIRLATTVGNEDALYEGMINAFQREIEREEAIQN